MKNKKTTAEQTEVIVPTTEKRYIKIHPKLYYKFIDPKDMEVYMELIVRELHNAVEEEEYEVATIYKRIFDYNTKRLYEGVDSIYGWNEEDTIHADRFQMNESGYYFQ